MIPRMDRSDMHNLLCVFLLKKRNWYKPILMILIQLASASLQSNVKLGYISWVDRMLQKQHGSFSGVWGSRCLFGKILI